MLSSLPERPYGRLQMAELSRSMAEVTVKRLRLPTARRESLVPQRENPTMAGFSFDRIYLSTTLLDGSQVESAMSLQVLIERAALIEARA